MLRPIVCLAILAAALPGVPVQVAAQTASPTACPVEPRVVFAADTVLDFAGLWDFAVTMDGGTSTGTMALGHVDGAYAGALTPDATTTVVIRRLTVTQDRVQMAVASREGDVLFDGRLTGDGHSMCGIVTYHGGARFPMRASHRRKPRS
jgi:hypothetical protein